MLFSGDLGSMHKALDGFKAILSDRETSIIEKDEGDIATKVCILSTNAFRRPKKSRFARSWRDKGSKDTAGSKLGNEASYDLEHINDNLYVCFVEKISFYKVFSSGNLKFIHYYKTSPP
eukprot:TRINITY_DN1271_c0_g2_i2.p2 TRINITY_DN1271_c0_g2~~TRINITY_DN1271_c0_g2_i2.p2  ORF type:complete len:119 (+),score=29.98 TRINITY_DN1271_c0_g2_i2:354-710(+)